MLPVQLVAQGGDGGHGEGVECVGLGRVNGHTHTPSARVDAEGGLGAKKEGQRANSKTE